MTVKESQRVRIIDSHTGGEPTRLVVSGGPDLGTGPLAEGRNDFAPNTIAFDRQWSMSLEGPT